MNGVSVAERRQAIERAYPAVRLYAKHLVPSRRRKCEWQQLRNWLQGSQPELENTYITAAALAQWFDDRPMALSVEAFELEWRVAIRMQRCCCISVSDCRALFTASFRDYCAGGVPVEAVKQLESDLLAKYLKWVVAAARERFPRFE
jgi:hypothetical protein